MRSHLAATLIFFAVSTSLLTAGFVLQQDWLFPLLAAINFAAGPIALGMWLAGLRRRQPD